MTPSIVTVDPTADFNPAASTTPQSSAAMAAQSPAGLGRTLLLAPPSLAAHPERLESLFSKHDRATTDLQMLDRLSAGLVSLPASTYSTVLVLSPLAEAAELLGTRAVFNRVVPAIRPGGKLTSEDGGSGLAVPAVEKEAILGGLVAGPDGFTKEEEEEVAIPIKFGLKRKNAPTEISSSTVTAVQQPPQPNPVRPAGVGFVDFSDDLDMLDDEDDDDLIDEEDLMGDDDLMRPIPQPPECRPQPGKKRRACKDCTCGLAERLEAKDKARREKADSALSALKLKSEDLNELDFTVQGKTGSCGSCSLGDAFRCADCPYIGLPPFKPGEEVKILNNVAQF